uniref:Uncharacterized protein n=1 Tax=Caenorhabditis japonica TaxID=281687 RepID=A0A8R1ISP0_CAEJA
MKLSRGKKLTLVSKRAILGSPNGRKSTKGELLINAKEAPIPREAVHAKRFYPEYKIHIRDPILKLISHKQELWIRYAFSKPGYNVTPSTLFLTPSQLLFPDTTIE